MCLGPWYFTTLVLCEENGTAGQKWLSAVASVIWLFLLFVDSKTRLGFHQGRVDEHCVGIWIYVMWYLHKDLGKLA